MNTDFDNYQQSIDWLRKQTTIAKDKPLRGKARKQALELMGRVRQMKREFLARFGDQLDGAA